jgi:hypothetical protein
MKTKNIVFRVDPGTYRQIEAEAKRRGLTVSSYVRLMATAPLVGAGPPDARPLNQELKDLIAEAHDVRPGDARARLETLKRSIEAVMAAHSVIADTVRWLVNIGQTIDDLDLDPSAWRRAAEAVMRVHDQIEAAARQLVTIAKAIDLPARPERSEPDASTGHAGGADPPDAG